MNLGRRARLVVAVFALLAGLLVSLGAHTVVFTIRTNGSEVVVESRGHVFRADLGNEAPLDVRYDPQERFSTEQVFRESQGLLLDGLAILGHTGRNRPAEPAVFRQDAGETRRYVLFDPFRGALTVHRGAPELRLEVNVPDDAIESWQAGNKTQAVKMNPPWLRLAAAPLLAAGCLAGLLACLAALLPGPRPAEGAAGRLAPAAVFVAGVVLSVVVFRGTFHAMPGFGDEMNYLIEGRILASGHLSVPEPSHPEFFRVGWMDMFGSDGRVWGFHPPGQSALLALGWLLGLPWLTIPLVLVV